MVITDVDIITKNCYEAIAVELFFFMRLLTWSFATLRLHQFDTQMVEISLLRFCFKDMNPSRSLDLSGKPERESSKHFSMNQMNGKNIALAHDFYCSYVMAPQRGSHTRRSCDKCHRQKLRCERGPGDTSCVRCQRTKTACTLTPSLHRPWSHIFLDPKHKTIACEKEANDLDLLTTTPLESTDGGTTLIPTQVELPNISPELDQYKFSPMVTKKINWTYAEHLVMEVNFV
jgi:hypothetical protein